MINSLIVKQIIQELARHNFNLYPESYALVDGLSTDESTTTAQEVANGYWNNRNELEIKRDEQLGIIKTDYQDWVMSEYDIYIQSLLH